MTHPTYVWVAHYAFQNEVEDMRIESAFDTDLEDLATPNTEFVFLAAPTVEQVEAMRKKVEEAHVEACNDAAEDHDFSWKYDNALANRTNHAIQELTMFDDKQGLPDDVVAMLIIHRKKITT